MTAFAVSKHDLQVLAICSVRYCLGRQTYLPVAVQEILRPFLHRLDADTRKAIARDIIDADAAHALGDARVDAPRWREFLRDLERAAKPREE